MDEVFEPRELVSEEALAALTRRSNAQSALRFALQMTILIGLGSVVVIADSVVFWLPGLIALAAVIASTFAPFHECTHSTAFASRNLNTIVAWGAALPFGMSPTFYREFHFAHHRHTQDPDNDPELLAYPGLLVDWPNHLRHWLFVIGGWRLLRAKLMLMRNMWLRPEHAYNASPWARRDRLVRMKWETRALSIVWLSLPIGAVAGVPGCTALTAALLLSHLFQSVWVSSEHTGLTTEGSILERTRTVLTPPLIRWFLWNMNFHAEHHGWPAVPWHRLEALHAKVAPHVITERGYLRLHRGVWRRMGGAP